MSPGNNLTIKMVTSQKTYDSEKPRQKVTVGSDDEQTDRRRRKTTKNEIGWNRFRRIFNGSNRNKSRLNRSPERQLRDGLMCRQARVMPMVFLPLGIRC